MLWKCGDVMSDPTVDRPDLREPYLVLADKPNRLSEVLLHNKY